MIIPDVNLLLYAHLAAFREHAKAKTWWERALNGTTVEMASGGAGESSAGPSLRSWSRLRDRADEGVRSAAFETPPAGYEESLRIYFDTLNAAREGENRP